MTEPKVVVGTSLPLPPPIEDPIAAALVEKGYVPHVRFDPNGNMLEVHWEKPLQAKSGMGLIEAIVLIACLVWLLFIIKGVPWG